MAAITLFVLLAYVLLGQALDPCAVYTVIDQPRRSAAQTIGTVDQLICDRVLSAGWYRFKDAEMPFGSCVKQYHCGTHVPLWLEGTHPTVQDGTVTRTACGQTKPDGDCCEYKKTVNVRNCGRFMVYHLSAVPGCSIAYCTAGYPKLTQSPTLSPPIVQEPDFKFICEIPPQASSKDDDIFEVTWLVDGKPIPGVAKETVSGGVRRAEIYGRQLVGVANKVLSCSVTSRPSWLNVTSLPSTSSGYWIGVKYNTARVMIDSSHTMETLQLTSTIPVVCNTVGARDCSVDFRLHTDNEHVFTNSCTVQLKPGNWNAGSHVASVSYVIKTEPTWAKTSQTVTLVTTTPAPHETGNIWGSIQVSPVQVEKKTDKTGALCSSVGDPHIRTFDSKRRYTTLQFGQFLMVRQRRGGSFRVEARTWKCSEKATCNCAVAVREGNDVITFDMCNGGVGKTVPKMEIKNPAMFTNQTKIVKDRSGNKHVLTFRSGAVVTVATFKRSLSVFVNLPASFSSDTEGLCGFFDGNEANDLTRSDGTVDRRYGGHTPRQESFASSWRIPTGQSLFEVAAPLPPTSSGTEGQCTCDTVSGHFDCSGQTARENHTLQILCPDCITVDPPFTIHSVNLTIPGVTTPLPTVSTTPYGYPRTTVLPPNPTTSLPQMNKVNATRTCEAALKKDPALRSCVTNQMTLEYQDVLDLCVMDMELTADPEMALSAVTGLMQDCGHQALVNPPSVPTSAVTKVCPRSCSLNGNCVDGKCVCDPGYETSDCSVKSGAPPSITGTYGGEYCDVETEDCFEPIMIGENMVDANMKCTTQEIATYDGKDYILQQDINPVVFHSTTYVVCNINPPPEGSLKAEQRYVISLSNNGGATVGNQFNYTVYSSKCLDCGKTQPCPILPGTCLINARCYPAGAEDTGDHTGFCIPAKSNTDWSPVQQTSTPATTARAGTISPVYDFRHYTGTTTGCGCFYDTSKTDCACCQNFGCPCAESHHDRCYDCFHEAMCSGS